MGIKIPNFKNKMSLKQIITPQYYFDMDAKAMIQLTLKVESPDTIPKLIDYYKDTVIPLHIKQEGNYIITHNDKVPVFKIPRNEQTKTLEGTAEYVSQHFTRPFTESLASISAGEDTVVLNIVHCVSDGGYFKLLIDGFLNHQYPRKHKLEPFPEKPIKLFPNLIKKSPDNGYLWGSDPFTIRLSSKNQQVPKDNVKKGIRYYTIRTPSNSLKCYNHKLQN